MKIDNFLAELKRRNIYKVAIAYAVFAWLLIQTASILFPTFEAPPWTMKIFIVAVALGFPIALVLAWAFELTPEGIKRAEEVLPNEAITHKTGWKLVGLTVAVAVIAAGLFAFKVLWTKSRNAQTAAALPAVPAIAEKSIAVLPFDNLSRDPDNAFASGIEDQIITGWRRSPI